MRVDLAKPGRKLALAGIKVQLAVGACLVLITALIYPELWLSCAIGVIAFALPHSIFAYWIFRYAGATKNKIVAQSLNQGLKLKLILTGLIFGIAFSFYNAHLVAIFGAYAITMVSQWTAMFRLSQMS
ncbi:ATP synthase subunit I [Glaciecola sp. XM2]|jgi:ATP synthase protein I|uniref:ATP synthase subunit I n=1 Tax=Glaciecola sp. XM2 TaxID=1914931 RepID=UPI001BDDFA5C|nr:ATP synthase subunit I [Glaciecola sp. XM2]MBT1451576.1 ATP synthase subunit I [Glaciecola sp. XM2]